MKTLLLKKESLLGIVLGIILIFIFIFLPLFFDYKPTETSLNIFQPPSKDCFLGTNDVGQDIMSRLIAGGRNSLLIATGVSILSTLLSLILGSVAALRGGMADRIIMRLVDVLLVIPNLVIIILISAYLTPSAIMEIFIIALLIWTGGARAIRAQVLSLKERSHVYAAFSFGADRWYILYRHILPELIPLAMTLILQGARRAIFMEAGLAFIGVVDPNVVSWGSMISHALQFYYLEVWKWWLLPVGGALALTMLSFSLVSYVMEEIVLPQSGGKDIDA